LNTKDSFQPFLELSYGNTIYDAIILSNQVPMYPPAKKGNYTVSLRWNDGFRES